MKRRLVLLLISLLLALLFLGWQWLRPYDWNADPQARYRIVHASLERDHSFYRLRLRLKRSGDEDHDLAKPVALVTAAGRRVEPADITMEGDEANGVTGLAFFFWLEKDDLDGPLELRLNDGALHVRRRTGPPADKDDIRYFSTSRW